MMVNAAIALARCHGPLVISFRQTCFDDFFKADSSSLIDFLLIRFRELVKTFHLVVIPIRFSPSFSTPNFHATAFVQRTVFHMGGRDLSIYAETKPAPPKGKMPMN